MGADFDNIFNHPLIAPHANFGGGGGPFAQLGDCNIRVHQTTGAVLPIVVFFFNDTAPTELFTLSLHDALPLFLPTAGYFVYVFGLEFPASLRSDKLPQL